MGTIPNIPLRFSTDLNISLEEHLLEVLRPLPPILPESLSSSLKPYTLSPSPAAIPSNILRELSQWSRSAAGENSLRALSPPLNPRTYSMISLLAGTTTSPEQKKSDYMPPPGPEEIEAEKIKERKTITALINAMLSIAGAGVAVWFASNRTGWKNEWKVLLALLSATVVAIAEAGLYIIWQSGNKTSKTKRQRKLISVKLKKD